METKLKPHSHVRTDGLVKADPTIVGIGSIRVILTIGSIIFFWIGVKGSDLVADEWGKDPKQTVIDEIVGQWITLIGGSLSWMHLLLGFLLFRAFDIAKPLGVRRMESLNGGMGVMMDDVAAGIYANLILQILALICSF